MISLRTRVLALVLAGWVLVLPGCIMGSPLAAISGEPYGMVRGDVRALSGKKQAIWAGAPLFAAIDLPFAAVLDTAFLPISLLVWGIKALGDDDPEPDDHDHGQGRHSHSVDIDSHGHSH